VVRSTSFWSKTWTPGLAGIASVRPSAVRTRVMDWAQWRSPCAANVAYALAMSSGVTSSVPRVIAHTGWSGDWMPAAWATSTTRAGSTAVITCA